MADETIVNLSDVRAALVEERQKSVPQPNGHDPDGGVLVLDPNDPRPSARAYLRRRRRVTMVCYGGDLYEWTGTHYRRLGDEHARKALFDFLERAKRLTGKGDLVNFAPTTARVDNVLDALKTLVQVPPEVDPDGWLKGERADDE